MKISVVIPTYNSSKVIHQTLESIFRQTRPADEIVIMDDGSPDDTLAVLNSYKPRIKVFQQPNQGVAATRNALCKLATGDLVASLDHDDLFHPEYLETQAKLFETHPNAVGFFAGHVDFHGFDNYEWKDDRQERHPAPEVIPPLDFFVRYNQAAGAFGSMSFCCVPKRVFSAMGDEPYQVSGVEDSYLYTVFPLFGPVVYAPRPLVAYRLLSGAQSANRVKSLGRWVHVFELLEERYRARGQDDQLWQAFQQAHAAKRRRYGKVLMGAGMKAEARQQFREAARISGRTGPTLKSRLWWLLTYLPGAMQPNWPSSDREVGDKMMNYPRTFGELMQAMKPGKEKAAIPAKPNEK